VPLFSVVIMTWHPIMTCKILFLGLFYDVVNMNDMYTFSSALFLDDISIIHPRGHDMSLITIIFHHNPRDCEAIGS
jgi:hypothetical protein